jgi:hypothetical protein
MFLERILNSLRHRPKLERTPSYFEQQPGLAKPVKEVRVQYVIYNYKNAQQLVRVFEQLEQKATLINPEALRN